MSLLYAGAEPPEQTRVVAVVDPSQVGEARRAVAALGSQIMLDEAFVVFVAEAASQLAGPEVARATVRNASWDRWGLVAYQDLWLER